MDFENVDELIAGLIDSGKVSWHDLETKYDLERAMNIWECITVSNINRYLAEKHQLEKSKKK